VASRPHRGQSSI